MTQEDKSLKNIKFYDCPTDLSHPIYAKYKVNQTEVLVGYRPNINIQMEGKLYPMNQELFNSIDSFINISDSYVGYPINKSSTYIPFDESGSPILEVVYSVLMTLNHQINNLKVKRIYIHCDLGSHRAPSIFGLYLFAFQPHEFKKITNNKELFNIDENYSKMGKNPLWSNPRNYARDYLKNKRIYTFTRNLRKNIKDTVSIEGLMKAPEMKKYMLEIYHARNYSLISLDPNPMYNSIYFLNKLQDSLKKEFPELLDYVKHKIKYYLYTIPRIEIHILLKTKHGQFWKKNNFGINWKEKIKTLLGDKK